MKRRNTCIILGLGVLSLFFWIYAIRWTIQAIVWLDHHVTHYQQEQ